MGTYDQTTATVTSGDYLISYCTDTNCTTAGTNDGTVRYTIIVPPPRQLLVKPPRHWKQSKIDGFAGLVNEETHTGWRVTALVRVQKIYDKNVEKLSMAKFKALMLQTSSPEDAEKIKRFFARKS